MRRAVVAGGMALVVGVSTGAGWLAASRVKSPAKLAAEAAPPEASLITYPVEKRVLSSDLIIRGTIRYSDPIAVVLAPSALRPPPVLISQAPVKGATLQEGDVAMVVSGRPVFALKGQTPGYRDLGPGSVGADVRQLEDFLIRTGFDPGTVDDQYDGATAVAVLDWYSKAGYQALGPNDQQRAALRLAESGLSVATDRLLLAKQAEALNRTGGKPVDLVDARAGIEAARASVVAARNVAERDAERGQADLAIKEADLVNKRADLSTRQAAVEAATIVLDEARRRDALVASGVNVATGVNVTREQLALLQEGLADAVAAVGAAEADLAASEAIASSVKSAGDASVTEARAKLQGVSVFTLDGLTSQEHMNILAGIKNAQAALALTEAVAARDNAVAAADVNTKKALVGTARSRVTQAQQRIENAKAGVDPVTGLPLSTAGDRANSQTAVKQAELGLRQAQAALSPVDGSLAAAQNDVDTVRRLNTLVAAGNKQSISDALQRVESAQARLATLGRPGLGSATFSAAVNVAAAEVARLKSDLGKIAGTIGIQVPANELVFFPSLPLRIDDTKVKRGDPATAEVMTVSGTRLAVDAALLTTEAKLTRVGSLATIEAPEYAYSSKGSITFIADKPGLRGTDGQHIAIEVTPDDSSTQLVGASVRITIPTRATNGDALIVPVSALSVRATGSTQLQIEVSPGNVRTVIVTAGLSAQGFVEIVPVSGSVKAGDRVVIGTGGPSATDPLSPDQTSPTSATADSVAPETLTSVDQTSAPTVPTEPVSP